MAITTDTVRLRRPSTANAVFVALVALSAATAASFARVFMGWGWLPVLVAFAVASHALALGCRSCRWGPFRTALASVIGFVGVGSLVLYRDESAFGLPTREVWRHATDDVSEAWQQFATVKALTPAEDGLLLAAAVAVWVAAWAADGLAFRARLGLEPIVPAGVVFVFLAIVAADRHRVVFTVAWLATALLVLLLLKLESQGSSAAWVTARRAPSPARSTLRVGGVLAAIAITFGGVAGPRLPGAGGEPLVDTSRNRSTRFVPDPLVDIKGRLTEQSELEAFTVDSDRSLVLRLTAATEFDGSAWRPRMDVSGGKARELALPFDQAGDQTLVRQHVRILDLLSPFLPAVFAPARLEAVGGIEGEIAFDSDTSTLLFDREDARGLEYILDSVVPNHTSEQLRAANDPPRGEAAARNLTLPADFPSELRAKAADVVAGQPTRYDQALALQQWFQQNFTYDLSFRGDQSTDAMQNFLDERRGYCAQFAGTYAAFARSLGLPARVAVGFTWGERGADGIFVVKGKHYHAWPEVLFEGVGWVPFEPTPGRGIPGAEQYTGLAPAQAGLDPARPSASAQPAPAPVPTTAPRPTVDDALDPTAGRATPPTTAASSPAQAADEAAWLVRGGLVAGIAGALGLVWLATLAWIRRARRRRRWHLASTPADQVLVAWAEASEALTRGGKGPRLSETPLEYANRVGHRTGIASALVRQLAADTTAAGYAPGGVEADAVMRSTATVAVLERSIVSNLTFADRLRWAVDPRPALRRRAR